MIEPGPHRILCIEDDDRLRRLLVEDLIETGYDVAAASGALSGMMEFFRHLPTLVLSDVRMSGVSGFDLFERLRRLDQGLYGASFIFLTALADRDNELRGRRLGADDYITKPVDYEILHEVIRIRLGGRSPGSPRPALSSDCAAWLAAWFGAPIADPPAQLSDCLRNHMTCPSGRSDEPVADGMLSSMAEAMPLGIMVLDGDGRIAYVNVTAAASMGRSREELAGRRAEPEIAAFARRHVRCANGERSHLTAERLPIRGMAEPLTAVARLAPSERMDAPDRVTVLFPFMAQVHPFFGELLQALFGLTPAERMLATEITGGANLSEVAISRGVTLETVRGQLKSVFGKVGVTRQVDLVRTLLSLQIAAGCGSP
jgi:CheY-like chemotaxis protein